MTLQRYTRSVDGTIPISALLYGDEDSYASQDGVGIYDGVQKSINHQNGTVYVTTHRLFYIDTTKPHSRSFALDLSSIVRTQYYAGLFTSSPKVTIYLTQETSEIMDSDETSESWLCEVCDFRNPPGSSPSGAKCALCGVPRSKAHSAAPIPPRAVSAPPSSAHLLSSSPPAPSAGRLKEVACPACTFLNHPALTECEICGTALTHAALPMKSAPSSRPGTPIPEGAGDENSMLRLSFRRGGDKALYAVLKRSLLGKAWQVRAKTIGQRTTSTNVERFGIDGLVRGVETSAQSAQLDMNDALKDLDALMVKAREMVRLAGELNERLTVVAGLNASSGGTEPDTATFIRSSLVQLGLQMTDVPVTLDMAHDEKRWYEQLARELAGVLQGTGGKNGIGMMRNRGIIPLDEVWGGWNRARGVALLTPSQFLQVLPHLPAYTHPAIAERTFHSSNLRVLHTPTYTPAAFAARLHGMLLISGSRTTLDIAQEENVPVGLVAEMVDEAEAQGVVCRDEAEHGEVSWWVNDFQGYVWDGQDT
ncbi:EAP30/Vps36 family-domain-containing protein [Multifurca ochricompacta]|uniref:Vacuolar protein-sorting-associated protein 36 n=1 Tax=Multifurca ochricompacta TaxID=376703 RepID=A0AAD4QLE9_9AGAM|nr:EAP30/Vps36 family-domain-containing protein [Multifurca ochricompacta]